MEKWMSQNNQWLQWAQTIDMLAQAGLTYTQNPFDIERYHQIREIVANMLAVVSESEIQPIKGLLDAQSGYSTPKLDVRGVVFKEDKILLVKELADGGWTLPGGWVDVNEPPSRAAEREVWEESGYRVKAHRLLSIYDRNLHDFPAYIFHIWKVFILCDLIDGKPTPSIETGGAEWFAEDALPELSVQRTTAEVIGRMFSHHRNPEKPAEFD
jgi:ADP-ribose pyrophosphatase YjhB (NUDIX family)